ncbi:MAG: hypothetical protein HY554_19400 [Elusimicrobia bacterium]|nr:hypothetical protein [Elusimicrobiota bacterium]
MPLPLGSLAAALSLLGAPLTAEETLWTVSKVRAAPGESSSIAVDSRGKPVIALRDASGGLFLARQAPGGWALELVSGGAGVGDSVALHLSRQDQPRLSYFEPDTRSFHYLERDPGSVSLSHVQRGGVGRWGSSAPGRSGTHAAFQDASRGVLRYAAPWRAGGEPSPEDVDRIGPEEGRVGIAIDGADEPHIVYQATDRSAGYRQHLRYARKSGGRWTIATLDSDSGGLCPAIALDRAGRPYVSYGDSAAGALKVARGPEPWQRWTVDSAAGRDCGHSSIQVDGAGVVHIAYHADGAEEMRHAWSIDGVWRTERVAPAWGGWSALALGPDGVPQISYYDVAAMAYFHAVRASASSPPPKAERWQPSIRPVLPGTSPAEAPPRRLPWLALPPAAGAGALLAAGWVGARRRRRLQERLSAEAALLGGGPCFEARFCSEAAFRSLRWPPWDCAGVVLVRPDRLIFLSDSRKGPEIWLDRRDAEVRPAGRKGGLHWIRVQSRGVAYYLTSETGLLPTGSREGAERLFRALSS